jgi:hypothetical protein
MLPVAARLVNDWYGIVNSHRFENHPERQLSQNVTAHY